MQLQGSLVRDSSREPVGRVRAVLFSPDTMDARWLSVEVEADRSTILVPAAAVSEFAPGELLAPYASHVMTAARHDAGQALSETDAKLLLRHYGFES